MTLIPSPASANLTPPLSAAQLSQLQPGDVINATVTNIIDETTLRLVSAIGSFDVQSELPLANGSRVELAVSGTKAEPNFTLRSPVADPRMQKFATVATPLSTKGNSAPAINSPAAPSPAIEPVVQTAAAIVRDAVTRQGGLAQLYADLGAVSAQPSSPIPNPVFAVIQQLFGLRLQAKPDGSVDASDILSAFVRSGFLKDALPANGQPLSKSADMGTLLSALRQALKSWAEAEANFPAAEKLSQLTPASLTASNKSSGPMPPYRNGPTVPQALASPSIPTGATPRELALHLLEKTDAAMARQMLLQIASLPDHIEAGATRADATRLTFDIPLATSQGTAVTQIRVERDGKNTSDSEAEPIWRANFSIDIEPIGSVHVRIALANRKTIVALDAERTESALSLNADLGHLEASLRRAKLEPGTISCRSGTPTAQSGLPGMFVDRPT